MEKDIQTKREREKRMVSEMWEKIRLVMRFSGPRMIFRHPAEAVRHVVETKKEKKRLEELT